MSNGEDMSNGVNTTNIALANALTWWDDLTYEEQQEVRIPEEMQLVGKPQPPPTKPTFLALWREVANSGKHLLAYNNVGGGAASVKFCVNYDDYKEWSRYTVNVLGGPPSSIFAGLTVSTRARIGRGCCGLELEYDAE